MGLPKESPGALGPCWEVRWSTVLESRKQGPPRLLVGNDGETSDAPWAVTEEKALGSLQGGL